MRNDWGLFYTVVVYGMGSFLAAFFVSLILFRIAGV